MLLSSSVATPRTVWDATWEYLSEDVLFKQRRLRKNPNLTLSENQIKNYALLEIEKLLRLNGVSLSKFEGMPRPVDTATDTRTNILLMDEQSYNHDEQRKIHQELLPKLTDEQASVYQEILDAVIHEKGGVFFVYGFGGTGKTYLWNILSAAVRSKGLIVLNAASSGIASLLLPGGRTAHSRFGIPINPNDFTTCSMETGSDLAEVIRQAKLIIWDEAPMMSK
ncbi:unnamed protein product, partial [Brassica rapa subsp. trilocularis]